MQRLNPACGVVRDADADSGVFESREAIAREVGTPDFDAVQEYCVRAPQRAWYQPLSSRDPNVVEDPPVGATAQLRQQQLRREARPLGGGN
jgi:hypothetical protein